MIVMRRKAGIIRPRGQNFGLNLALGLMVFGLGLGLENLWLGLKVLALALKITVI